MNSIIFKKKTFLVILLMTSIANVYSQDPDFSNDIAAPSGFPSPFIATCNNTLSNTSADFVNKYRPMSFWIPTATTPIKTVQIAMHIFTGTNSLSNIPSDINWLNAVVNQMNVDLANNCLPGLPSYVGVNDLVDTKIRFELAGIYFYNNPTYYNSNNTSGMLSYISGVDASRLKYLPVLVPIGGGIQNATVPYPSYISSGASVSDLYNSNLFAYVPTDNTLNWTFYTVLKHELGHCLDLLHTYLQNLRKLTP